MKNAYLRQSIALALGACVSTCLWAADSGMELKSDTDKTSYALGYQIGSDFKHQRMELNEAAVVRAIADARTGAAPIMSEESMRSTLIELKRKVVEQERLALPQVDRSSTGTAAATDAEENANGGAAKVLPHARRPAAKTTEGALEFFDKNAKEQGVLTLAGGVQYKVLKIGTGKQARDTDKVALNYRGSFINGKEFGNTDREGKPVPKTFSVASLVPGMREAISQMHEGDKWQVFIPPQLGFDASTPLYRKVTVFDVELVAVNP